jgi:prevent-host-death family protein
VKLSDAVKPISYIKAHASEVIRDVAQGKGTIVITLNGEAKAVLQDIREFENTQETLALLKILAMSKKSVANGKTRPAKEAFRDLQEKVKGLAGR